MGRVLHARDIDAILAAGFDPSEWLGDSWDPGYRVAQDGRRRVLVYHDGPGEEAGLDTYTDELRTHGYHVVPDQQPGGGRRRLHITQH